MVNLEEIMVQTVAILERRDKTTGFMLNRRLHSGTSGEYGKDIFSDASGNVYVCGDVSSTNLITNNPSPFSYHTALSGPFGASDMFIGRFTGANFTPDWQTYFGSVSNDAIKSREDVANAMLVDAQGSIYVAGRTNSGNYEVAGFPTIQGIQGVLGVIYDGAIVKFSCGVIPVPATMCNGCKAVDSDDEKLEYIDFVNGNDSKIYPNPFTNEFSVLVSSEAGQIYLLEISDMSGVIVSSKSNLLSNVTITMGGELPIGIYIVKLITGSELKTYKLIKTN